jgi:uncharacterized membrane protein YgaE (UPF0421/DUF939 family)
MGIRVLKTALAATVAVYLAWLLKLDFFVSAGILAILSVEVTRKKNLQSAGQRLLASILGLAIASILFESLGYHMWVLGLFVAIAFPLLAFIHLKDGIVTGAVIVFHVFEVQQLTVQSLSNELLLLLIGIGTATVINLLYMPNEDRQLIGLRQQIEQGLQVIFQEIGDYIRTAQSTWDGEQLLQAEQAIRAGMMLSHRVRENEMFKDQHFVWYRYFEMRDRQMDSVRHMLTLTAQVSDALPQGEKLSTIFAVLAQDIHEDFYTGATERELDALEAQFKQMTLPQSRAEFETRSALLQLMVEMRRYLAIAKERKGVHSIFK